MSTLLIPDPLHQLIIGTSVKLMDLGSGIMKKKLEEIWIVIAWIMLLPLIFIFKLLGKLQAASVKQQAK